MEINDATECFFYWGTLEMFIIPFVFIPIFALGIVGNGTLILIFLRHRIMRNATNIHVFAMALGDLLVITSFAPTIYLFYACKTWSCGEHVYAIVETIKAVSIGVSVFSMTAFTVEQYRKVVHPTDQQMSSKPLAIRIILAIWVISIVFASPTVLFSHCEKIYIPGTNGTLTTCSLFPSREHGRVMITLQFLIYYLIPIVVMSSLYFLMKRHTSLSTRSSYKEQIEDQPTQIVVKKQFSSEVPAFLIIFIVCSFPSQIYMLCFFYYLIWTFDFGEFWYLFDIIAFYVFVINFCVKPVVLYLTSKSYRKYLNYYLVCCSHEKLEEYTLTPATNTSKAPLS